MLSYITLKLIGSNTFHHVFQSWEWNSRILLIKTHVSEHRISSNTRLDFFWRIITIYIHPPASWMAWDYPPAVLLGRIRPPKAELKAGKICAFIGWVEGKIWGKPPVLPLNKGTSCKYYPNPDIFPFTSEEGREKNTNIFLKNPAEHYNYEPIHPMYVT